METIAMDRGLHPRLLLNKARIKTCTFAGLSIVALIQAGCSFGPQSPNVRNALDMLRIERDAAEDQYYDLKEKHEKALWKIEDLESSLKGIQEQTIQKPSAANETFAEPLELLDAAGDGITQFQSPPQPTGKIQPASFVEPNQSEVNEIRIDPQMTRGFDSHGKSGDDGIVVAVQPTDQTGEFVPIAAPITVSLIDPSRNGIRQRVGLWKFTSQQVANRFDRQNSAFVFRMPWQRNAPINSNLKLFVRFQANDGKRETSMDLNVVLDGQPRARWTQVDESTDSNSASPRTVHLTPASPSTGTDATQITPVQQEDSSIRIARPIWSPTR